MGIANYKSICRNILGELRDYQQKAKLDIFSAWDLCDNVMFQMPTGTGKTRLFTSIINDINQYGVLHREHIKILIIAHRTELIQQIDESLDYFHVPHGIIAGAFKEKRDLRKPVQVASIQTITNKYNRDIVEKLDFQFIIIDEAHHSMAETYKKLWKWFEGSKKLGVTATPWRMSGSGFTQIYDKLILSLSVKEFIKQGRLSSYKYFSLKGNSNIRRAINRINEFDIDGDYKLSALERTMDKDHIRAQLLNSYKKLAWGKKGIIYAISIAHAQHICKMYKDAGLNVVAIDSNTPASVRKELVRKFKDRQIDIIVNVDIFSEGFDCPEIEFIQLARPTKSLVKYIQQVGRGLRPNGDTECYILDNVGLHSRFGLPDSRRHWNMHFKGTGEDEDAKYESGGFGESRYREIDMTEGDEEMVIIQEVEAGEMPPEAKVEESNVSNKVEENEGHPTLMNHSILPPKIERFDPHTILEKLGYQVNGDLFWHDINSIYDAYIYKDGDFIIERLAVLGNSIKRILVAKVQPHTMLYYKLESGKASDIQYIHHLSFHRTIIGVNAWNKENKENRIHHYDYIGAKYNPNYTVENLIDIETTAMIENYEPSVVDLPVEKTSFQYYLDGNNYIIGKGDKPIPVACVDKSSELGKLLYSGQKFIITHDEEEKLHIRVYEAGVPKLLCYNKYGICTTGRTVEKVNQLVEKIKKQSVDITPKSEPKKEITFNRPKYTRRFPKVKIDDVPEQIYVPRVDIVDRNERTKSAIEKINDMNIDRLQSTQTIKKKAFMVHSIFSKKIFDDKCQIVVAKDGYYVNVIGSMYYYLAQLNRDNITGGSIWIKSPKSGSSYLKIVHAYQGEEYVVGLIDKRGRTITFIDMNDKERKEVVIYTNLK